MIVTWTQIFALSFLIPKNKLLNYMGLLLLILLYVFRFQVGDDWFNYEKFFLAQNALIEPLYYMLQASLPSFAAVAISISMLVTAIYILVFFIDKKADWTVFILSSFLQVYIILNQNYLRQSVAAALVLLSYAFFMHGYKKLAPFAVLIALGFHFPQGKLLTPYLIGYFSSENVEQSGVENSLAAYSAYVSNGFSSKGASIRILYLIIICLLAWRRRANDKMLEICITVLGIFFFVSIFYSTASERVMTYFIPFIFYIVSRSELSARRKYLIFTLSLFLTMGWEILSKYSVYWQGLYKDNLILTFFTDRL